MLNQCLLVILGLLAISELSHSANRPSEQLYFKKPTPASQTPEAVCMRNISETLNSELAKLGTTGNAELNKTDIESVNFYIDYLNKPAADVNVRIQTKNGKLYERQWVSVDKTLGCSVESLKKATQGLSNVLLVPENTNYQKGLYAEKIKSDNQPRAGKAMCLEPQLLYGRVSLNIQYLCDPPAALDEAEEPKFE